MRENPDQDLGQNDYRFFSSLSDDELDEAMFANRIPYYPNETRLDAIQDLIEANVKPSVINRILSIFKKE